MVITDIDLKLLFIYFFLFWVTSRNPELTQLRCSGSPFVSTLWLAVHTEFLFVF
jgi:hypothetical protein